MPILDSRYRLPAFPVILFLTLPKGASWPVETTLYGFGEMLKAFRKRKHMTQKHLAQLLGVHGNTVSSWEVGTYLPETRGFVLELARQLKLDKDETLQLLEASLIAPSPRWYIPFPRNPCFTGREEILGSLHQLLSPHQSTALSQSCALYGLGGIGKTQIVLEYVYRHTPDYSALFWIDAESTESIMTSFAQIAALLELPEREGVDQQRIVTAVQRWLSKRRQWLLIWDNLEDFDLLAHFLPPAHQGVLLITTRSQAVGTLAQGMELLPMGQEEGVLFLLRRAKWLNPQASDEHVHQLAQHLPEEYAAAEELVRRMGGLPLALDQAGAFVEETGCSLSSYVHQYQNQHHQLLDRRGSVNTGHPHSVIATLELACLRVAQRHRGALELLRTCAFLSPNSIPEELFAKGASSLGPMLEALAIDPLQLDLALAVLRSLSLVQRYPETQTLSLHRMVQATLVAALSEEDQQHWAKRVLCMINQVFPQDQNNPEAWPQCERLLPHALVSLMHYGHLASPPPEYIVLLTKVARYLTLQGRYREAEGYYERAYALQDHTLNTTHPERITLLLALAQLSEKLANFAKAGAYFQQVQSALQHCSLPDPFQRSSFLNSLATLFFREGNYDQAILLYGEALVLREEEYGTLHPKIATVLGNLAMVYTVQARYQEAEPLYQRALLIQEQTQGSYHLDLAGPLNNLALLYCAQQRYQEAEPLYQRALLIREQTQGLHHPDLAAPLNNLADVYSQQGKYAEARSLLQRALFLLAQAFRADHPERAYLLASLAELCVKEDREKEAEEHFQRALSVLEQQIGLTHPNTAKAMTDLASLYEKQGKVEQACSLMQSACAIFDECFSQDHPDTVKARDIYCRLLERKSKTQEAWTVPEQTSDSQMLSRKQMHQGNGSMSVPVRGQNEQVAYVRKVRMREVTFTCTICGQIVTQMHYPSGRIKYCSEACRAVRIRQRTEERVHKQREKRRGRHAAFKKAQQEENV